MTAADLATTADVAKVLDELRALRSEITSLRACLPPRFLSLKETAERLNIDTRTVVAMCKRNELVSRRCGRRIVVDAASLRAADADQIARAAREARGS